MQGTVLGNISTQTISELQLLPDLRVNVDKTTIELHNFNADNAEIEIVEDSSTSLSTTAKREIATKKL